MADGDVRCEDLEQETPSTLSGNEQFVMFDSVNGKRADIDDVATYITGDKANLQTTEKGSIVGAINEVNGKAADLKEDIKNTLLIASQNETIISVEWENGAISNGQPVASRWAQRTKNFIELVNLDSVILEAITNTSGLVLYMAEYDSNKTYLGYQMGRPPATLKPSYASAKYIKLFTYSESTPQASQGSLIVVKEVNSKSLEDAFDAIEKTKEDSFDYTSWMIDDGVEFFEKSVEIGANYNNDGTPTYIYKHLVYHKPINGVIVVSCDKIENALREKSIVLYAHDSNNEIIEQKRIGVGKYVYYPPSNAVNYTVSLYPSVSGGLTDTHAIYNNVIVTNNGKTDVASNKTIAPQYGVIPAYYLENGYITNKINTIRDLIEDSNGNYDAFIFCTDQHWTLNAKNSPDLIAYIMRNIKMPRLFMGGDYGSGINLQAINAFRDAFDGLIYDVVGNHEYQKYFEWNDDDTSLNVTGTMIWAYLNGKMTDCVIGDASRNYYYVDNTVQKMRYIILSNFAEGTTTPVYQFEQTQIDWFDDVLSNMPDGYTAVIFIHAISSVNHETGELTKNYAFNDVQTVVDNYDGKVAGIFGGHTHFDGLGATDGGVPVFVTTCDKYKPYVGDDDYLTDIRTLGTITEQAFDVVVIDKTNRKVTAVRIGCPANNPNGSPLETRQMNY